MTVLEWAPTTELPVQFPVSPVDASGGPVAIIGVDCALLPYRSRGPTSTTVWKAAVYNPGVGGAANLASIVIAGPDAADPTSNGFRMAGTDKGGDLWARYVSGSTVDPEFVARIDLKQD